jgi:hypothetical protein
MDELEVLRIRDEVLQAMYWMRSEGLTDAPPTPDLARFLIVPEATLAPFLERFRADGLIESSGDGWALTPSGEQAGKRAFADEFADMTGGTHGECDENCWCHSSPEAAEDCLHERAAHAHH